MIMIVVLKLEKNIMKEMMRFKRIKRKHQNILKNVLKLKRMKSF